MTKYQLEHFKEKVDRQFEPMIRDQELLVKQYKTEATDKAVSKLSKKIGADTIIEKFAKAEKLINAFYEKKGRTPHTAKEIKKLIEELKRSENE